MTSERWEQIDQLFHAALAYEPSQRADFLTTACAGDEPLRLEVESLISSHQQGNSFIETPAGDVAAELLNADEFPCTPGEHETEHDDIQPEISKPANAYQAYQLSRYYFHKVSFPDLIKSRVWLEEAVRLDPDFAPAHAALAEQRLMEAITGLHAPPESFPKAKEALRRASELNPDSTEFYATAGFVDLICDWNFEGAEWNLRKSLELNPYHVFAYKYLGEVLMFQLRSDEAETYLRRAVEMEPLGLHSGIILTIAYFLAQNYQKVIEECEKFLVVYPRFVVAMSYRCWALEQTGRAAEAVDEYEKILREPGGEIARRWIGYAYALVGDREKALETARQLDAERSQHYLSPTHQALLYAALSETEKAFSYLEQGLGDVTRGCSGLPPTHALTSCVRIRALMNW